jgi:hypothetical protein
VDEGEFWRESDDCWDVIEPESEVHCEQAATEPEIPTVGLDSASFASTETVPEHALRVVLESSPQDARQTEASPAGRYAGLFTRLKRRRREAAEAIWAGVSLTAE